MNVLLARAILYDNPTSLLDVPFLSMNLYHGKIFRAWEELQHDIEYYGYYGIWALNTPCLPQSIPLDFVGVLLLYVTTAYNNITLQYTFTRLAFSVVHYLPISQGKFTGTSAIAGVPVLVEHRRGKFIYIAFICI